MTKTIKVKVVNIRQVFAHNAKCCYFNAAEVEYYPPKNIDGFIGGFLDELIKLKKNKKYEITVKELRK